MPVCAEKEGGGVVLPRVIVCTILCNGMVGEVRVCISPAELWLQMFCSASFACETGEENV